MLVPWSSTVNLLLNSLVCIIVGYFNSSSLVLAMSVIKNYCSIKNGTFAWLSTTVKFRKSAPSCISPSKYKPPKHPPFNRTPEYKPPGGLHLEIALKYKLIIK